MTGWEPRSTPEPLAAQLSARRTEMMASELEAVALRLFEQRGYGEVTVDELAAEAQISVRTFYRYFPAKEDVFQVRIDRRSEALRVALAARPTDEPPFRALRLALEEVIAAEDAALWRRWTAVIAATPSVVRGVLGGIQLKSQGVIAEFFGTRLGLPSDDLVPQMLAAAAGGVIQAAQTNWYLHGGDLTSALSQGLAVLERGVGANPASLLAAHNHDDR